MALVGTPKLHREFRGWCQNYRPVCGGYPASAGLKRLAAYLATGGATDSGRADRSFWLLPSSDYEVAATFFSTPEQAGRGAMNREKSGFLSGEPWHSWASA